jgi:hypothetical protein
MEIAIIVTVAAIALGVVAYPLFSRRTANGAPLSDEALNEQVARYREAIRSGTLCDRCLTANPADSRYCSECGRAL